MNKMFKKLMAVSATVAIAATMSVSAFAADVTVAPTDKAVTVTPTEVKDATMYTVMVFSTTADITDAKAVAAATPVNGDAIYYINQGADVEGLVTNMLVKATSETEYLPAGNYVVRIGNDQGSVQNFALESKVNVITPTTKEITITIGDVNGDSAADGKDASLIVASTIGGNKAAGGDYNIGAVITTEDDVDIVCGDVNGDGVADGKDASLIVASTIGGNKAAGGKYNIGASVTFEVPVVADAE